MEIKLTINTDKVSRGSLEKLLVVLYTVEDELGYEETSVSKSIDELQDLLLK